MDLLLHIFGTILAFFAIIAVCILGFIIIQVRFFGKKLSLVGPSADGELSYDPGDEPPYGHGFPVRTDVSLGDAFMHFLDERNLLARFAANCMWNDLKTIQDPDRFVMSAFDFNETVEGREYWDEVDNQWERTLNELKAEE